MANTKPKRILVIEDERDIAALVAMHLKDHHFQVELALDGHQGERLALSESWDLIILDLCLPGTDGLSICRHLRQNAPYLPVLMLTSKTSELDRVLGLELGADDYMTKPFSVTELIARVKAILRRVDVLARPRTEQLRSVTLGDLHIDKPTREVTVAGEPIELTAREFDLLWHFASHPGRVYNRAQLLDSVWGSGHEGYEHTVNSHINRLRSKIERDTANPEWIVTVWGVGYKMAQQDARSAA